MLGKNPFQNIHQRSSTFLYFNYILKVTKIRTFNKELDIFVWKSSTRTDTLYVLFEVANEHFSLEEQIHDCH